MRIAGVRLGGLNLIWANAGDLHMQALDYVVVRLRDGVENGQVYVTPEQIMRAPAEVTGAVLGVLGQGTNEQQWSSLPGSRMPPLATWVRTRDVEGMVTAIDPLTETVTVETGPRETMTVSLKDLD